MSITEFNKAFQKYYSPLMGYAMNLTRDPDRAKDLTQETAYRAFKNRDKFKMGTNLRAWLSTIMRNIFINNYRKKKKRQVVQDPVEDFVNLLSVDDHRIPVSNLESKRIMKEVKNLDDGYRKPFLMQYEGYKYKEIAEKMGIPLGTVKSRIFFARKKLQEKLAETT